LKRATQAAEMLKQQLGIEATLIPGAGGVFKVMSGSEVITQRTREHFPDTEEIVALVQNRS